MLAASSRPTRETKPFTADVITASGSSGAGTHKQGLRGAGGGPRESREEKKAFPDGNGVERGGALSRGRGGGEASGRRGQAVLITLLNITLRKQNHPEYH